MNNYIYIVSENFVETVSQMCCSIKYAMPTFIKFPSGQAYIGGIGVMVGNIGIWDPHDPSKMGNVQRFSSYINGLLIGL